MCGSYSCRDSKIMDMYLLPFEAKEKMAFFHFATSIVINICNLFFMFIHFFTAKVNRKTIMQR